LANAWRKSRRASLVLAVGASLLVGLLGSASPALAASTAITSAGPLTRVEISTDLNCAVDHTGDTDPEFFEDTACATLVAVGGTLYGPANIPAGGSAAPRTTFTPVSQSAVTGSGTNANPYKVVTVVGLGSTSLQITQTDSYVVGQETYRTDVVIENSGGSAVSAILYRAGDCYLQNSDYGFGAADAATGSVSCVAGVDNGSGTIVPGTRIEQWYPLSAGSSYNEDGYNEVWAKIGTQTAFANTCTQCANYIDNGAGLSWNVNVPAHGSVSRSNLTVFSPLGVVPLTTTKTAAQSSVAVGAADSYTITVSNTNAGAATLTAITDTLPAGFSYTLGSTTGATTADPSVAGQVLTWNGSFTVPAAGSLSLTFGVTASTTPGTYTNEATATAQGQFTVAGTGPTAPITVGGTPPPPAHLTLVKTIDNTGGGTAAATDWTLTATGPTTISGHTGDAAITNAAVDAGTYTLSEAGGPTGYTPSAWSCTGGTLSGSSLVLAAGDTASCSIRNTFTTSSPATYASILLDRSGSMARNRTIRNYNQWLADEQQALPQARATLALFNSCGYVQRGAADRLITKLHMLTRQSYKPRCRTPLYDAIARTINRAARDPLSAGHVVIVIYTDSRENASTHWTRHMLDGLIAGKVAQGWTFVWLGHSLDPLIQSWAARQ
jgi:uncharacterized repeat protein (TIGR01451 family)